jgi:thiol:disulfide interchange protein DsbA
MKVYVTGWLAATAFALLALAVPAHAQLATRSDYVILEPAQLSENPAKIEVIEFFSYACPHCGDLAPHIGKWAAKLPADTVFKRIPVAFNSPFYQIMVRLYYTLDAIGELERLDEPLFNAIHVKGLKLLDEKSIAEWVTAQGVDAKRFSDAYNSFGVSSKSKRADQLMQAYKIRSVPTLVVDGKYIVSGNDIKSHVDLLARTDRVIEMRRAERNPKKK